MEYVQYVTEKSIEYVNMTKAEKSARKGSSLQKKYNTPVYQNRWFGVIPFVLKFIKGTS